MNLFYRIGVVVAMFLSSLTGFGQSKAQKIFDKYHNEAGVTSFSFSKSMIDAMNMNLDEEGKKITGDFQECKIMIYSSEKGKISHFSEELSKEFSSLHYEQVHPKGEKSSNEAEFWIEGKGNRVTECHIILGNKGDAGNGSVLVSFYGNFKVEDLGKLEKIGQSQSK